MNTVWGSLLWKEWREHRWKMAALVAVVLLVPTLSSIKTPDVIFGAVTFTVTILASLGSMFVGMHAAAGEQSQGTIRFLQALPMPMAKPAAAKLLWGALTITVPVVAAVSLAALWRHFALDKDPVDLSALAREEMGVFAVWGLRDWYASMIVCGAVGGVSLFVWMAAAGVNRSDEVRAGAIGLLVILVCWAALMWTGSALAEQQSRDSRGWPWWLSVISAGAPAGPASLLRPPTSESAAGLSWFGIYSPFLAVAVVVHGAVAGWYIARFGRGAKPQADAAPTRVTKPATEWLAPPRRSPATAMVWKQTREAVPLAVMGAALVAVGPLWASLQAPSDGHGILKLAIGMSLTMGSFVAIVAGIGAFMDDLRPGLYAFWRSRPVNVKEWFAIKFSLSLLATVSILAVPLLVIVAIFWSRLDSLESAGENFEGAISSCVLLQVSLFAGAAAAMILVRQAIYAAILTIGVAAAYMVAFVVVFERFFPRWDASEFGLAKITMFAIPTIAATILAWFAVKNDWGWKG